MNVTCLIVSVGIFFTCSNVLNCAQDTKRLLYDQLLRWKRSLIISPICLLTQPNSNNSEKKTIVQINHRDGDGIVIRCELMTPPLTHRNVITQSECNPPHRRPPPHCNRPRASVVPVVSLDNRTSNKNQAAEQREDCCAAITGPSHRWR